jgi:hypothetical protein
MVTDSEGGQCPGWRVTPVTCFGRLPEDSTPVPKHVGVDTMNCVLICIVLYFIEGICRLIYSIQETLC